MKARKAFNMVEIMIVVCLLLTTVVLCIPTIFNNSKQARIISGWKRLYGEMQSNFEVFNVGDANTVDKICASNVEAKDVEIFKVISPYMNVDLSKNTADLKSYNYKFKNGAQIPMQSMFFTRFFSYQENGNIVGFKWMTCHCTKERPCATVLFDMNGVEKPNRMGKDIFGIFIYKDRLEAFGAEIKDNDELERDCAGHTNGTSCSEYYLRGGKF